MYGDRIILGGGKNVVEGSGGADTFVFKSANGNTDVIKDFSAKQGDRLEISNSGFGSEAQFSYNASSGGLFFGDTQIAILENKPGYDSVSSGFVRS